MTNDKKPPAPSALGAFIFFYSFFHTFCKGSVLLNDRLQIFENRIVKKIP